MPTRRSIRAEQEVSSSSSRANASISSSPTSTEPPGSSQPACAVRTSNTCWRGLRTSAQTPTRCIPLQASQSVARTLASRTSWAVGCTRGMPTPVEAVMVGAGNRGYRAYGAYALHHPTQLRFTAVVEPDAARRERFAREHRIAAVRQFAGWEELNGRPLLAQAAINATLDPLHVPSTLALLGAGYEVLLEKPVATTPEACLELAHAAERQKRIL